MAGHLSVLLDRLAAAPAVPLRGVGVLTDAEVRRLLVEWNDTGRVVPVTTLPELLAGQVARTPGSTALVFEGERLSYAEFGARVDRLAGWLVERGVGPERTVAVVLPRSTELVVAVWAVLRAGGGYLPVDPGYPGDRGGVVLGDARAAVGLGDVGGGRPGRP